MNPNLFVSEDRCTLYPSFSMAQGSFNSTYFLNTLITVFIDSINE